MTASGHQDRQGKSSPSPAALPPGRFHGTSLRAQAVGGLMLTDYAYRPGARIDPHHHETAYLSLVLHGGYEESLAGGDRCCPPGTVTFHPAGERHSDRFGPQGGRIFTIEFEPRWLARASELAPVLTAPAALRGGALAALMLKAAGELARMDELAPLALEGLALEALAEATRSSRSLRGGAPPAWLVRIHHLVNEAFRQQQTLEALAAEARVHPVHLVREFRRFYGTTIGAALRTRRIELASRLLAGGDLPIAEVALEVGFSSQSHFSTAFRRATGATPAAYRRRHRLR